MPRVRLTPEARQLIENTLVDARELRQQISEAVEAGIVTGDELERLDERIRLMEANLRIWD